MGALDKVTYIKDFLSVIADSLFVELSSELNWVRYETTPRLEYYINVAGVPYTYGAKFPKTYLPQPDHKAVAIIRDAVERLTSTAFEVCFLNRYLNQSDHLGWHSDDSPEMDDSRPIAIVSLGVEREIWFREKGSSDKASVMLANGSLCLMGPGMQDTHEHRIPKSSRQCGERISLTFRGYTK